MGDNGERKLQPKYGNDEVGADFQKRILLHQPHESLRHEAHSKNANEDTDPDGDDIG